MRSAALRCVFDHAVNARYRLLFQGASRGISMHQTLDDVDFVASIAASHQIATDPSYKKELRVLAATNRIYTDLFRSQAAGWDAGLTLEDVEARADLIQSYCTEEEL